jgi:hypothetical protein
MTTITPSVQIDNNFLGLMARSKVGPHLYIPLGEGYGCYIILFERGVIVSKSAFNSPSFMVWKDLNPEISSEIIQLIKEHANTKAIDAKDTTSPSQ